MNNLQKTLSVGLLGLGIAMSPLSAAIANGLSHDATVDSESASWSTYLIGVTNSSSNAVEMRKAVAKFRVKHATSDVGWSSSDLSWPTLTTSSVADPAGGFNAEVLITFPEGSWVDTILEPGESFIFKVSQPGIIDVDELGASTSIILDGDEPPTPGVSIDIISPAPDQSVMVGSVTTISALVQGDASKVEFWAGSDKVSSQDVKVGEANNYDWTANVVGPKVLSLIAFDAENAKVSESTVSVNVVSDADASNPPVITFTSPTDGDSVKVADSLTVSATVSDLDDDLKAVTMFANDKEIYHTIDVTADSYSVEWTATEAGDVAFRIDAVDAEQHKSSEIVSITVTASEGSPESCGDVPQYTDGVNYLKGDQVSNAGFIAQCEVPGWCGNPVWTPITGHPDYEGAWKDAWSVVGECDPNPTPDVNLLSPADGDRIQPGASFSVTVKATDDVEVTKVDVVLDGSIVATSSSHVDDVYTLAVPAQAEGNYKLFAAAYDDKNAKSETAPIEIAVTDKDLVVSLTSPADGSSFIEGRAISLSANAKSYVGDVTKVEFYAGSTLLVTDTQAPYEQEWIGAQVGAYSVYAKAYNDSLSVLTASSTIEVKVKPVSGGDFKNNPDRSISYLTSWGLSDREELYNATVDAYMISFGRWDASGNVTISDGMVDIPKYDPWNMLESYLAWTTLKFDKPEKAMLVAFGGQTYESIWSHIDTSAKREVVANNLIKLLDTEFPVYKKGMNPEDVVGGCDAGCNTSNYQLAGYVQLDGLDFDFEKAARITDKENKDLEALIDLLREKAHSSTILTLTTYHVGADPLECADNTVFDDCSYIENARSSHHGEITDLLINTKDKFDVFNVMTYDAGKNFQYKVSLNNFAKHIGDKSKIILGNTINKQWSSDGGFTESREENIERVKWQKDNGFGGWFMWTLGSSGVGLSMAEQVEYFNAMDAMN